jgi:hypothetical protein
MANCSLQAKKLGVIFSKNIKAGKLEPIESITALASGLRATNFNPIAIAHVIHGAMKIPLPATPNLVELTEIADIESYINSNLSSDAEQIVSNLSKLSAVKGFETFEDSVKTLMAIGTVNNVSIAAQRNSYLNVTKAVGEQGIVLNPDSIIADILSIDNIGTEMLKRKSARILKTRGLKETSSDFWTPFLSTYFPGMSGVSTDFSAWAKDKFYAALIDNTQTMGGFIYDINGAINKIKKQAENDVLSSVVKYTTSELNSSVLNGDVDVKEKYFNEVLATDFDFILNNMIKSITVSAKDTKTANSVVAGFSAENGEVLNSKVLNIEGIKHLFSHQGANNFTLKGKTDEGMIVSGVVRKVDYDTLSFNTDKGLDNNAFYFTTIDEKYFYRNQKGENTDITPIAFYSYNSASKRNSNSFDPFIGALDSDSTFIHNLFQMFRTITQDPEGRDVYGERMTVIDFLTVAPYLANAGRTQEEFLNSLTLLAAQESPAGKVANTLLVNVFSPVATRMGNGDDVFSLYQATQKDGFLRTSINHQVVKALQNALINKDNVRYLKLEEGVTSITRGLDSGTPTDTVNSELSGVITKDGYTKDNIASRLTVSAGNVSIALLNDNKSVLMSEINSMAVANAVAIATGLHAEFKKIRLKFEAELPIDRAEKGAISVLTNIIHTAAVNMKKGALESIIPEDRIFEHPNYVVLPPSSFILGEELGILASLYNVDSHKSVSVGGSLTASTSTPNRDSSIAPQIKEYERFNNAVNPYKFTFNPFLSAVSDAIPAASYEGQVLKTPMVVGGDAIKLSSWDVRVRLEYAMVQGFLQAPKNIGTEFYLQPVNYSDKSNIPMHMISIDKNKNLLDPADEVQEELIAAYIAYQALKNEDLQRVTLHSFKEYVVGNFESLYKTAAASPESEIRVEALIALRAALLEDFSLKQGNLTKEINKLLALAKIHPDTIKFSNANLDSGADYMSFEGNPGAALIKPHLGVRAELFRDPVRARKEVDNYLASHRQYMESKNVDSSKIEDELSKASKKEKSGDLVSSANDFYDRFFLINGIYGHALKTLTMGDESYFASKKGKSDPKNFTIEQYYQAVDQGERTGLEEVESMLVGQFKRAQSELTRGNAYVQKGTIEGLKRKNKKDNLLVYLEVYGDNKVSEIAGVRGMPNNTFEYPELEGKSLIELEGLGIISRFENGALTSGDTEEVFVKFNIGKDQMVMGSSMDSVIGLKAAGVNPQLVDSVFKFLNQSLAVSMASAYEARTSELASAPGIASAYGLIENVPTRETALDLDTYFSEIEAINKNNFLVMPDLIPSITISDPISYINLLNSMGNTQENSDAIQFMHPLMSLIMEEARGGVLGAFNTDNQEALKTLTTTFEYDKMRQVLQKKSVQMPFTDEQMKKLGSVELYNTFKKMNTAIRFKKSVMSFTEVVANRTVVEKFNANNLHELYYEVMNRLSKSGIDSGHTVSDSIVWRRVMEILRQNPINLYSFVGLITVPSNQKTGHKKLNHYGDVFSRKENTTKPNIDYMANEYSYEVLTKAHAYDVTGEMHEASTLTLLSQLVNAVSFGGLSNLTTQNLQNAMGGKMAINSLRVGKDLANIATKFKNLPEEEDGKRFDRIIERFQKGDVSTYDLEGPEKDAYNTVLRAGVYEMANLAFQKSDSLLIHKIIKGENIVIDADGNVQTETGSYSLDSPAVRSKVMGTLRSAFFDDTVKMKMSGFIGTVSATHKTINIFTLPNGKRVGRSGYIKGALEQGLPEQGPSHGRKVEITFFNKQELSQQILPFDDVHVVHKGATTTMRFGSISESQLKDPATRIYGIITPDVLEVPQLDAASFERLDQNALVRITKENGKKTIHYKWYLTETLSSDELAQMLSKGELEEDITEKYSLRWYDYFKETGKDELGKPIFFNLKSSDAYRQYYRAAINKVSEEEMEKVRALLILETQSKDEQGNPIWSATRPEVVLPTYMGNAFKIPAGLSITEIIGTNGEDRINAAKYFDSLPTTAAGFITLTAGQDHYIDQMIRIYSRRLVLENNSFDQQVYDHLTREGAPQEGKLDEVSREAINKIITTSRERHINGMASDFIAALEVAMTRIPGQGKQSAFMGDVIEFLDSQGNATFAPTDHLVNTGGDMDIDTLSVLTKSIDSNGRMYSFTDFLDGEKGFSIKNMTTQYELDLELEEERIKTLITQANEKSELYITNREAKLLTQKTPEMIQEVTRQRDFARKLPFSPEKIQELIAQSRKKVHSRYENLLANAIADGIFRSLDNVDSSVELNTPISMGMFDAIIERVEAFEEANNKRNSTVSVNRGMSWRTLKDTEVYSGRGVNVMNTSAKKKEHEHFGNPFTGTGTPGLVHVGKHFMTREELLLPENAEKKEENVQAAVEMYKKWLLSGSAENLFYEINGYELDLSQIAPAQKAWIKKQIAEGKLDGETLLDMSENLDMQSHANVLADIAGTRFEGPRNGENYTVIFEYENLAAQGKEAIGIFATVLKINSAIQAAKINYDTNYKNADRASYSNPFFFNNKLEYVNFETGQTEEKTKSGFADLDRFSISQSIAKSTDLQKTLALLVNKDPKFNKDSVITLVNILTAELKEHLDISQFDVKSEEALELLSSLSKSLFDITLPNEVRNADNALTAFASYLKINTKLVAKAYTAVIGKQLSHDAQSQYLSAATDNAKELILGKIKSNQLSNPIITALMLLGYDTKTTIEFLYDPTISAVLDHFAEKVSNLEMVSINKKAIKEAGFEMDNPAIESLVTIIKIGEEINKFRSVRSLNENSQIEQYKLDKIMTDMDADVLYRAIVEDNIDLIQPKNSYQDVFNPNLMVFLHPQSRFLFRSVYESEKFKMPALFNVVQELYEMSGEGSRNMNAYKNISGYLSQYQVEKFLNVSEKGKNAKGDEVDIFRTGVVVTKEAEGDYTLKNYSLNEPGNRALFVKNFETYVEYAKEILFNLQGAENAALANLGRTNTYNSSNLVYYFPKLKNTNVDSLEISQIHEGINELKIKTGNEELDSFNRDLYNNLSLYALIVSSGEIKKGSMIEAFEEINLDLAKFLGTLTSTDYWTARATTPFIADIIKGEVLEQQAVIRDTLDNKRRSYKGEEEQDEDPYVHEEPVDDGVRDDEDMYEDPQDKAKATRRHPNKQTKEVKRVYKGVQGTLGKVFTIQDPFLRNDIFYAYRTGEIAYRLFPSEASEALPVTTIPSSIDFKKLDKTVVRELAQIGMQIGMSAKYDGLPVRILAYAGSDKIAEQYLVAHSSGTVAIAGVHLMQENPDLLLMGNIIQQINGRNRSKAADKKKWNQSIIANVPNVIINMDTSIAVAIDGLFSDEDIHRDIIISRESRVLGTKHGAYDVIGITDPAAVSYTPSYVTYLKSDKVRKANKASTSTLIPTIFTDVRSGAFPESDTEVISEMMSGVVDMLNTVEIGNELTFFGIKRDIDFTKNGSRIAVGGIDLLDKFLKPFKIIRKDKSESLLNNSFEITRSYDEAADIHKVVLKKIASNASIIMVNNTVTNVVTVTNPLTKAISSKDWLSDQVKLKALEEKLITAPHKAFNSGIEGFSKKVTAIRVSEEADGYELFYKEPDRGFNDKFVKLQPTSEKVGIFGTGNTVYFMPQEKYAATLANVNNENNILINPGC